MCSRVFIEVFKRLFRATPDFHAHFFKKNGPPKGIRTQYPGFQLQRLTHWTRRIVYFKCIHLKYDSEPRT